MVRLEGWAVGLITSRYLLGVDYVRGGFLFRMGWVGVGVLAFCVSLHFDFTFFFSPFSLQKLLFFFFFLVTLGVGLTSFHYIYHIGPLSILLLSFFSAFFYVGFIVIPGYSPIVVSHPIPINDLNYDLSTM